MRAPKTISIYILMLLLSLSLGCPSVNKTYPERTYFLFETPQATQRVSQVSGTSVDVNRFSISPTSEGIEFIYRMTDLEYQADFYNQFFRPPDNIITEVVRQWLGHTGLFEDVLTPSSQALADYIVEGNIVELYGDFRVPTSAKAVITIQLFLLKSSPDGSNPAILLSKTYHSEIPIAQAAPSALMNGWNSALEQILGEFLTDLSYHLKQSQMQSVNTDNSDS